MVTAKHYIYLVVNIFVADVKSTTLTHVIPSQGRGRVTAVTSLGDDVFVARRYNYQVEVYDAVKLTLQRRLTVPGLGALDSLTGLAVCPFNNCLYASDWSNDRVHRVELSGSNAVKKWSVASCPAGLSVNSKHKLIVTCREANKLQEYTMHGSLVREIGMHEGVPRPWLERVIKPWKDERGINVRAAEANEPLPYFDTRPFTVGRLSLTPAMAFAKPLQVGESGSLIFNTAGATMSRHERMTLPSNADVTRMLQTGLTRRYQAGVTKPWHAIQLSTGDYVVSQHTSPGVVSVVGVDGQVVRSYGQSQTSDVGQMKNPSSLAVTKNDDILVADTENNRILSINSSLGSIQELALSVDGGIKQPRGLCLDESRGRLYVGEWDGERRVLVFDLGL